MFMSCFGILIVCFVKILAQPPPNQSGPPTTPGPTSPRAPTGPPGPTSPLGPTGPPGNSPSSSPAFGLNAFTELCRGDGCRPPPNLVGPIVGSLCGILVVALIGVFLVWFCLRRKHKKKKEVPMPPAIKYIEQPPLYTGAISTTDSQSRLYGMTPTRNDSISSLHYYEKINYSEP